MIKLQTLPNGVRIVTEKIEAVRSCSVGLWLAGGSILEDPQQSGTSHFIEHMLFKGTRRLGALQIADAINLLGGNVNAFTTPETLCLHAKTVDHKAPLALDLLGEMLTESVFPEDELRRERQVVLEEHRMYEDNPDDLSVDRFVHNLWPGHSLGRPVIGTRSTIRRLNRERIVDFWARHFQPRRLLISIAGSFDTRACKQVIRRRFKAMRRSPGGGRLSGLLGPEPGQSRRTYLKRPVEQTHFCMGTEAPHRLSPDRYAFGLMNMILGGGVSSRLFQEIREKRGLAYSIGSYIQMFRPRGYLAVYGGTRPASIGEVVRITLDEMTRICEEEVSEGELAMAREQVLDGILLGLENTENRMTRLAESVMTFGRVIALDDAVERIKKVEPKRMRRAAAKYLSGRELAVSMVGPEGGRLPIRGPFRL